MKIFTRTIEKEIENSLYKGRLIILYGPRQSGKTTLSKKIIQNSNKKSEYFDCQLREVRDCFVVGKPELLLKLTKNKKLVVFDEAQTIENIGTILKVFHDTYKETQIIATGSSSFDLANKIIEPMTGRSREFTLLPLSLSEIFGNKKPTEQELYSVFLYGCYPAVVAEKTIEEKQIAIKNIATNYLYKDIFMLENIKHPKIFEDLLRAVALQIGSLVSIHELSITVGASRETVHRYLKLLEQSFIIKRIYAYSNNPRIELKKSFKIYFMDTGVRNAIVDILSPITTRADKGGIFENFFFTERLKYGYTKIFSPELFFWRTRTGLEIDFIEKEGASVTAYECKWKDQKVTFTRFLTLYPQSKTYTVTHQNIINFK